MANKVTIGFDQAELDRFSRLLEGHLTASGAHCGEDDDTCGIIASAAHCGEDDDD